MHRLVQTYTSLSVTEQKSWERKKAATKTYLFRFFIQRIRVLGIKNGTKRKIEPSITLEMTITKNSRRVRGSQ